MTRLLTAIALLTLLTSAEVAAGALERIKESGVLKIGVRVDAAPFSYKNEIGEPAGFTVDLCRAVSASIKKQLGLKDLTLDYIPVSAEDRFEAVRDARIELLCGAATMTLSRRELVDFSLPVYIDGASVLLRADGPKDFKALAGHKVGVRAGTTTETALSNTLKRLSVDASVAPVADHEDGLAQLESGEIAAYFADQTILFFLRAKSGDPSKLRLSKGFFSHEPYGLALPLGDAEFRLAVDRALSRIYRSGAVARIFETHFRGAEASDILKALYVINGLPE